MCVIQSITRVIPHHFSMTRRKLNSKKIKIKTKYITFLNSEFFLNNYVLQYSYLLTTFASNSCQIDEILLYLPWNFNYKFPNTNPTSPIHKFELVSQIHKTHLFFFKLSQVYQWSFSIFQYSLSPFRLIHISTPPLWIQLTQSMVSIFFESKTLKKN